MNYIKFQKSILKYAKVEIHKKDRAALGNHLEEILFYIDEHSKYNRVNEHGNAYKEIRVRAKQILGRNDTKFSKREIKSLITYYICKKTGENYIRIPYKLDYIFKAIFSLVDEYEKEYPLSPSLKQYVGQIRRECFYNEQSRAYKAWYEDNASSELHEELLQDMFGEKSSLNKKF